MDKQTIDALSAEIYNYNEKAGWWDNRSIKTALMLVITEIAEATEGERKGLMDDHLPHRKMGEVELADALIRMLDVGGRLNFTYTKGPVLLNYENIFEAHFSLCKLVTGVYIEYANDPYFSSGEYSYFIDAIFIISEHFNYDVKSAMYEKLEYNKTREDHKRENRAKKGGKKV